VNSYNLAKLNRLQGEMFTHQAILTYKPNLLKYMDNNNHIITFPKDTIIVEKLTLKPGCLIIINKNIINNKKLVNGTQAIFNSFNPIDNTINIKIKNGTEYDLSIEEWEFNNYYIKQYPVMLAWALTIHKAQGMGIERLSIDIGSSIFNDGQAYVALSRASNQEYLNIENYLVDKIKCNPVVKRYYDDLNIESNKWYQYTDKDNKIYYENKINGKTVWKLPKNGIIIK
jgi:hypothetical protein